MFDRPAALQAEEGVHGGQKLVRAGQSEKDDFVAGKLSFEPLGVLNGIFEGMFILSLSLQVPYAMTSGFEIHCLKDPIRVHDAADRDSGITVIREF